MSLALHGEITAKNGAVIQGNFDTYPVVRMDEAPAKINVHIMENDALPGGVGEPGVPPVAPALANAWFAATGERLREMPFRKAGIV
jgi:isoquinoline 1-oxidoreductase beta subunit